MRDFFVSYNKADEYWAEWIASVLEEAGFTTVIQAWDFRPGHHFINMMQQASTETQVTIAVLSDNYLSATMPQSEWTAAFVNDPIGLHRKLIPIRISQCQPTGLLKDLIYVDLVGLDEAHARGAVLRALEDRVKPPMVTYPGKSSETIDSHRVDKISEWPNLSNVGLGRPANATFAEGRERENLLVQPPSSAFDIAWSVPRVFEEEDALRRVQFAGAPVVIWGPMRFGKTWMIRRLVAGLSRLPKRTKVVELDVRQLDQEACTSFDAFLGNLATAISGAMSVPNQDVENYWKTRSNIAPSIRLTCLIEDLILKSLEKGDLLILAIDAADMMDELPYKSNIYRLMRAWAERSTDSLWSSLRMIFAVSTTPARLTTLVGSPFNIGGPPIILRDLAVEQVQTLARIHGLPWGQEDLKYLMEEVGGHPYLIRRVMYFCSTEQKSLNEALREDVLLSSVFQGDLRWLRKWLNNDSARVAAVRNLIARSANPISTDTLEELLWAGLIDDVGSDSRLRYRLYERFLRSI